MDPYSAQNFVLLWPTNKKRFDFVRRDAAAGSLVTRRGVPSPYPVTSFVVLAPLSLLAWTGAQIIWIGISLLSFVCTLGALVALAGVSWLQPQTQLFLAIGLALAPFHTGLATENPAIFVIALSVGALWAAHNLRDRTAGVLLALAICLKPQMGLCFLLFYLIRRRWKIAIIACAVTTVIAVIAAARLAAAGVPWITTYLENSRKVFAPGAINDFTPANPVWFNMVNLQVIFYPLMKSAAFASGLAMASGAALAGMWLWIMIRKTSCDLLELSALATLSLLPMYHRFYDAALLILPLCWALLVARERQKGIAIATVVLILPFLVPGAALLGQRARSYLSATNLDSWWWNGLVMSHQVWALLLLSMLLVYAMAIAPLREPTKSSGTSRAEFAMQKS
jgi:hypothetical protein